MADTGAQLDFSSSAEFSLAAWVRGKPAQESGAALIAKGTGGGGEQYAVDIFGNAFRFFVRGASGAPVIAQSPVPPDDTWQHVVAVYSRTLNRMKLYVNKTEVGSIAPLATDLLANAHEVSLGARQLSMAGYDLNFNGVMDDVRIYARALTPADVTALYNEAPPKSPTIIQQPQTTAAAPRRAPRDEEATILMTAVTGKAKNTTFLTVDQRLRSAEMKYSDRGRNTHI